MNHKLPITVLVLMVALPCFGKSYKHASEYIVGTLDHTVQVETGNDTTAAQTMTDAKLSSGGKQSIHFVYTSSGVYRVEAPINLGKSMALGMLVGPAAPMVHNHWFLDDMQPGTQVLLAPKCKSPNKNHPYRAVSCTYWVPDPDSDSHEYISTGDYIPNAPTDGSNVEKTASALCGTGKLKPDVEAQICSPAK